MTQPLPPGYAVTEVDTQNVQGADAAAPDHGNEYAVTERDTTAMGADDDTAGAGAPEFSSGNSEIIPDTGSGFAHVSRDTAAAEGGPGTHYAYPSYAEGPGAFVQDFNQGTEDTTQAGPPVPSNKVDLDAAAAANPDLVVDNDYQAPLDMVAPVDNDYMDTWGTAAGGGPAAQGAAMYSSNTGLYGPDKDDAVPPASYDASRFFRSGYDENPDYGAQYVGNVGGTLNVTAPPAPAIVAVTADPLGQRLNVSYELAADYAGSEVTGVNVYVYKVGPGNNPEAYPTATRLGAPGVAQVDPVDDLVATGSETGGTLAAGTYYYKVTAVNSEGETVGSNEDSATIAGATGSVSLAWSSVLGAVSYKVYRGTGAGAENTLIGVASTSTTFVDTGQAGSAATVPVADTTEADGSVVVDRLEPEVSYRVAVAAVNVNGEGARSALSAPVKVLRTHGL